MVTLINPNLVAQSNDLFTTGIVYMPIGLAYFAAALRQAGHPISVIDAFGEKPRAARKESQFLVLGLTPDEVVHKIPQETKAVFVYAINLTYHRSLAAIVQRIKRHRPELPVVVMENTQAVTAYAVKHVQGPLHEAGADYILAGEAEQRGIKLVERLLHGAAPGDVDGIGYRRNGHFHFSPTNGKIADLDALSFPAWDLFPLQNYWKLNYAHGPLETGKYLPMLTSRGCPYPCKFCVIPETNDLKWRPRSAKNVVDEMESHRQTYGVREFHIEDVDPTISDRRIREICHEIIDRKLEVIWKIAAGTKVESLKDEETIALMARAGCRYISISPESGSPRVLKLIKKPFKVDHAVRLVQKMNEVGIRTQACFVLGFPGENDDDRQMTWDMVRDLTKVGVDEIALFIITPVPGSAIFNEFAGYDDYSQLNFSPTWRQDYQKLNRFRLRLYRNFLLWKARYHPLKMARQPLNFLRGRFETKMEMAPYRALKLNLLQMRTGNGHLG
jgi:radical SAM superfamily enzyme YgiQ (UPF0313 family)